MFLRLFEILQAVLGAFQATFVLEEATFLRVLMVGIASINGSNCSLGREFLRAGQAVNFRSIAVKVGIVLPTLPRCQRCVSTIHVCRKYVVDSIFKIMINRIISSLLLYTLRNVGNGATRQRFKLILRTPRPATGGV